MSMSYGACSAVCSDGRVVTWGAAEFGGDSSSVSGGLCDVSTVCSTAAAFAALRGDGSVVTWGDAAAGGDSRCVQHQPLVSSCTRFRV